MGALGERENHGWWPTSFFSRSAKLFLEPVFPRTSLLAQYHGTLEAARRVHDEHLSVGSFHVFRMPEEVEQDIQDFVASMSADEFEGVLARDEEVGMEALRLLADGQAEDAVGPILCGNVDDILARSALSKVATIYHRAFEGSTRAYPYFEANS